MAAVRPAAGWPSRVPGNFDQPSHTIRTELAATPPYDAHTGDVAVPSAHDPRTYLEALAELGCEVDAWETTYLHVLTGEDPVFTWVSGTGARPTLQALPEELRPEFEREFKARLRAAYPERAGQGRPSPSVGCSPWEGPMRLNHVQVANPVRRGPGPPVLRRGPRHERGREAGRSPRPRRALMAVGHGGFHLGV